MKADGKISLAGFSYAVGASYAGEPVEVVAVGGLAGILHAGMVVASHAQRLREDQGRPQAAGRRPAPRPRRHQGPDGDPAGRRRPGGVSFAGTPYACGRRRARQAIDVTIVAGSVELSKDGKVIRVHPIRHDRSRELGAFANPKGRPRRKNSGIGNTALRSCRLATGTRSRPGTRT